MGRHFLKPCESASCPWESFASCQHISALAGIAGEGCLAFIISTMFSSNPITRLQALGEISICIRVLKLHFQFTLSLLSDVLYSILKLEMISALNILMSYLQERKLDFFTFNDSVALVLIQKRI